MGTNWYRVAAVDDLPEGQVITVVAGCTEICLTHTREYGYTALDNCCPHWGGPLGKGQLEGGCIICPWHGFEFNVKTGLPPAGYTKQARPFPVEVRADGIYVKVDASETELSASNSRR